MELGRISRRQFLYGSAVLAGSVALASCTGGGGGETTAAAGVSGSKAVGSSSEPLAVPGKYQQAPMHGQHGPAAGRGAAARGPVRDPARVGHRRQVRRQAQHERLLHHRCGDGRTPTGSSSTVTPRCARLNDGKDVVPGLVESWESNDDASEWTFHFRKGLKWSDGEPWTTADIMFWWDDIVAGQYMAQTAPDEARSGKGTLAKFTAVDELTLKMTFDAPAPLTADRMAMWVNGSIGKNGPIWMMPSHYVKQFHPEVRQERARRTGTPSAA